VKEGAMVPVRHAIIFVAQILALLFIVVSTMAGALAGHDWLANTFPILGGAMAILADTRLADMRGVSIFGAVAGFFISTMLVALFFLLVEIAHNTRNPFNT
jgi:hypothetical protein